MRVDWDAYFDGSMPAEERARIDADPQLCTERDGFAAFRTLLKDRGRNEIVPTQDLLRRLSNVASRPGQNPAPKWVLRFAPLLLGLTVLALYLNWPQAPILGGDRFSLATSPVLDETPHADAASAAEWLSQKAGVRVPVVSIAEPNTLVMATFGKGWVSMTYVVRTKNVSLQMAYSDKFREPPSVELPSGPGYRGDKGIGWRDGGVSFYVTGCEDDLLRQCAARLQSEIRNARWVGKGTRRGARPTAE